MPTNGIYFYIIPNKIELHHDIVECSEYIPGKQIMKPEEGKMCTQNSKQEQIPEVHISSNVSPFDASFM